MLEYLGKELAKLHQIPAPEYLPKSIAYGKEYFEEMATYAPQSDFHLWLMNLKKELLDLPLNNFPKALVHGDVFYSNVIVQYDRKCAIIMDFEGAAYYYRIFDIGMMIVGICRENNAINTAKAKHLLEGYQAQTPLLSIELNALPLFTAYAAGATAFWRYRQYHILNPEEAFF